MSAAKAHLTERLTQCLRARDDRPQMMVISRTRPTAILTGHDLQSAATSLLAQWRDQFGSGGHIFVVALPPGALFLSVLMAGLLGRHIIVPVAPPRTGSRWDRFKHVVQNCDATAVLTVATLTKAIVGQLADRNDSRLPCPVVAMDEPGNENVAHRRHRDPLGHNCPAIIQYTSGSTRLPKGVHISGEQICANADLVAQSWDLNATSRVLNWLPHYHDMGLMGGILYPLLAGGLSIQMSSLDVVRNPVNWLRAVSDHQADFSGGPAFAFADCLKRISPEQCEGLDLSCWTRAFCGAEPIPAGLLPSFMKRFSPYGLRQGAVFGCYGLAEATLFAAGAPEHIGSFPNPPDGCAAVHPCHLTHSTRDNLCIVNADTGMQVEDGTPGEIWLRGPSKGLGYVNLPDETEATFFAALEGETACEWLRTGDLGVIGDDLLYVIGRLKDTLIVNGRKIAAAELEWLAASFDEALNPLAAAAFAPDALDNAAAILLIELKSGCAAPDQYAALHNAIERAILGEWGIRLQDFQIVPRGRLARTSSGKIRRQVIAEDYRRASRLAADDTVFGQTVTS